jgi:hypothetical protein
MLPWQKGKEVKPSGINHGRCLTLKLLDSLPSKQTCFHEMRNLGLHVLVAIATRLILPLGLSSFITNDCCRAAALARALKPG